MRDQILSQIIWYNSYIRIAGAPIKTLSLSSRGLNYIRDILTDDFQFMKYEHVSNMYGTDLTWLMYNAICSTIPSQWIRNLKRIVHEDCTTRETSPYSMSYNAQKQIEASNLPYKNKIV